MSGHDPLGSYDLIPFEETESIEPAANASAQEEARFFAQAHKEHPNSIFLRLGKESFISWHADNGVAIFAIFILFGLIVTIFLVAFLGIIADAVSKSPHEWITDLLKILGQAVLTVVGAVLGASAGAALRGREGSRD